MTLSRRAVLGGAVAAATVASTTVATAAADSMTIAAAGAAKTTGLKPMTGDAKPITPAERKARLEKVQGLMQEKKIAALLVESGSTLENFTGIHW